MDQRLRDYYIESQVNNATPGQMLIMLYDCLIERAECAQQEISAVHEAGHAGAAAHEISRCINILTELNTCLRRSVHPALCSTLADLYLYFMRQFSDALETHRAEKIQEILPLIRKLRATWAEADRRANSEKPLPVAAAA